MIIGENLMAKKMVDGKSLERLVSSIERILVSSGLNVQVNSKTYLDGGSQLAEFDVVVSGRVGSTNFDWLLECRDRKADGPANGAWIEQLAGRKLAHGFHKVTAVSTTGFSAGAVELAKRLAVEIREVEALDSSAFGDWVQPEFVVQRGKNTNLLGAAISFDESDQQVCDEIISRLSSNIYAETLESSQTGQMISLPHAFSNAVGPRDDLFGCLKDGDSPVEIRMDAIYADDDFFYVHGPVSKIRVNGINFHGTVSVTDISVPLMKSEYRDSVTGELISQSAVATHILPNGREIEVAFHRVESGETVMTIEQLTTR